MSHTAVILYQGSEVENKLIMAGVLCICGRLTTKIMCTKCGEEFEGRIYRMCPVHLKRIPLMDVDICVNKDCRSSDQLIEFDAFLTKQQSQNKQSTAEYTASNSLGPPPGLEYTTMALQVKSNRRPRRRAGARPPQTTTTTTTTADIAAKKDE